MMDRRNSKDSLLAEIERLNHKLDKVYQAGRSGISHVGFANYAEREAEANRNLDAAYYDEIYSDE